MKRSARRYGQINLLVFQRWQYTSLLGGFPCFRSPLFHDRYRHDHLFLLNGFK